MNEFYNNAIEEQETTINILYAEKKVSCYTSRKLQIERLEKKLGKATKYIYTKNKISGAIWIIPFEDKKAITKLFSRPLLIGAL